MEDVLDAAVAAYRDAWPAGRVFELGEVPGSAATPYGVVMVSTPSPGHVDGAGRSRSKTYRVVVQCIGRTAGEVSRAVEAADRAFLQNAPLTIAGWDVTRPHPDDVVSSQPVRDPDGGALLSATVIYPVTAYPTPE